MNMKSIILCQREVKGLLDGTIALLRRPVVKPYFVDDEYDPPMSMRPASFRGKAGRIIGGMPCLWTPFSVGEILCGKETWIPIVGFRDDYEFGEIVNTDEHVGYEFYDGTRYWPDGFEEINDEFHVTHIEDGIGLGKIKWRSSTQMPVEAARIFLKVKAVKVEKLRDISNEDALKEGIYDYGGVFFHMSPNDRKQSAYPNCSLAGTPKQARIWA